MAVRLAVLIAVLLLPAPASAAVTIGSSLPPWTGETLECTDPGGCTFVPRTIAGTVVAVPYNGVIVGWSGRMPTAADTTSIAIGVVRPTATGAVGGLGSVTLQPPTVDGAFTTATGRLPVRAGDLIGVDLDNGDEIGVVSHPTFDSSSWSFVPKLGDERPPDSIDSDDFEALFNATIEPDVDRDGYGDETQDRCPQLVQEHARTCTGRPTLSLSIGRVGIGLVDVGKQFEIKAGVFPPNHVVPQTLLKLTLPAAVKPLAIRGTAFCTTAANEVTCPMGDLPAGRGHLVYVDVLALRPADTEIRADLTTGLPAAPSTTATAALRVQTTKPCGLSIRADVGTEIGTKGGDRITGSRRDDTIGGRAGDDCLFGRAGDDLLFGGNGDDNVDGGRGDDLLRGDAGDDRLFDRSGEDRLEAGPGNDRLDARDGHRDIVRCGPGHDRARVDRVDSVAGCERVRRARRRR